MNSAKVLNKEQFTKMAWKNGKGETLELVRQDDELGMAYRISQAQVIENGEFSSFEGLQRFLVLIAGNGITLTHHSLQCSSHNQLNQLLDIASFDGAATTTAQLTAGAITDLNIMFRAEDYQAQVSAAYPAQEMAIAASAVCYFYANQASVLYLAQTEQDIALAASSLLTMEPAKNYSLTRGSGVYITLSKRCLNAQSA